MDRARYDDWVRRSLRWIRDSERDLGLPHHIQLLGIVDSEIRGLRRADFFDDKGRAIEDSDGFLLQERAQIRAHLWVLGTYEFVRMLSQRVRETPELTAASSISAINETKLLFERVRIPLAKLEPASRHRETDYAVALPGVGTLGLGWKIADDAIIYQEQLSDAFLGMLSAIRPLKS